MSDDRTNQIENLYASPEGVQSGSFFGGTLSAIPRGIMDASAQLNLEAKQLYQTGGEGDIEQMSEADVEALGGMTKQQALAQSRQDIADTKQRQVEVSNYLRPNPQTSGIVANTLYGVADVGTRIYAGSVLGGPTGGALLAGGSTGMQATTEAEAQGVDSATATRVGLLQGGLNALGVRIPMSLGGSLATRLLTGAAINTAMNEGGQQLTGAILRHAGYNTMADQYQSVDAAQVASDIVLGAFFGGRHREVSPDQMDAAVQQEADARHETEAAPGAPLSINAMAAHDQAMDIAREQLLNDQHVELGDTLAKGEFLPVEDKANREESVEALKEAGYVPSPDMSDEAVRTRFATQLEDYEQARLQYADLPETEGGKVINTDIARELSPDYLADRTRSAAVHEPASALTKQMYADLLNREPQPWENPDVMFTAGGTGAGKTTAIAGNEGLSEAKNSAQIVYDTNMNSFESADTKVKQALDAGKNVQIAYVYRDPLDALVNGALPRAERQKGEFGSGRTVPIEEHIRTHEGALKTVRQLAEKYKDDPRVAFTVLDNSHGKGNAKLTSLDALPETLQNSDRATLMEALRREYQEGRISQDTYRGFAGQEPERVSEAGQQQGASDGEPSQQTNPEPSGRVQGGVNETRAGQAAGATPEETLARQIAAEAPDRTITYRNEAGNEVTETASQALARLDDESSHVKRYADAVKAAVTCALRYGA